MGRRSSIGIVRIGSRKLVAQLCHWCRHVSTQTQRRTALANGIVIGISPIIRPFVATECPANRVKPTKIPLPDTLPDIMSGSTICGIKRPKSGRETANPTAFEVATRDLKITTRRVSEDFSSPQAPRSRVGLGLPLKPEDIRHAR